MLIMAIGNNSKKNNTNKISSNSVAPIFPIAIIIMV
jgi:hypothetical protein